MNFQEYIEKALKTKAPVESDLEDLRHGAAGIVKEVGELVDLYTKHKFWGKPPEYVDLLKEVGDVYWYLGLTFRSLGGTYEPAVADMFLPSHEYCLTKLVVYSANLFAGAYGSPESSEFLLYEANKLYQFLNVFCIINGLTKEDAWAGNLVKLQGKEGKKGRYSGSFSQHEALNRNLELENENELPEA